MASARTPIGAEEKSDFAGADAEITGRHVDLRSDMAVEFAHERVAEIHHFQFGFALGVKIASAFAAAHGQSGQSIFEGLFKTEELQR